MANAFTYSKPDKPAVKYKPCANAGTDDELEEISIVTGSDGAYKSPVSVSNGPSTVGCNTAAQCSRPDKLNHGLRNKLIGERLSSSGTVDASSPMYATRVIDQKTLTKKTPSRGSLFDSISNKIDKMTNRRRAHSKEEIAFLNAHLGSKDPITPRIVRKYRKKEIQEKFGKKQKFEKTESFSHNSDQYGCKWTFVFDPAGRLCYWWSLIVSIAFLYNFWILIYRYAFNEIVPDTMVRWFLLDYTADLLYILDIVVHFRTGFLEEGVLQTSPRKMRIHYMNSSTFYIDCLCLLPLDFMYLSIDFCSMVRCFRLVKIYRFWAFIDRTERHTNYPNAVRTATLLHYLIAIFHWNACLLHIVEREKQEKQANDEFVEEAWVLTDFLMGGEGSMRYLKCMYWSTLALTTIGHLPQPKQQVEYAFMILELVFALLLFATVLGHIANIVANVSAARKEFQAKLDGVKTFMSLRRVPLHLQDRVIKWFDYLWFCNKTTEEDKSLSLLPDKLKAEIAIHVHLDTLKRVEIFQNTEAGFLCELVLKLCPVLFSPGDYICRKGEIGKEMYIVNRGRLQVVADNGKTVLATLKPGSYFGEISILNMGPAGNRRTASVRSVGYSDLFKLSKQDLWDVLKEYPAARVRLEAIAVRRLEKYKKAPVENSLTRSISTPGLVESTGQTSLILPYINTNHTTTAQNLLKPNDEKRRSNSICGPVTSGGHVYEPDVSTPARNEKNNNNSSGNMSEMFSTLGPNYDESSNFMHLYPDTTEQNKSFALSPPLSPNPAQLAPSIVAPSHARNPGIRLALPPSPISIPSPSHLSPYNQQLTPTNSNYQIPSPGARSLTPNYLVPVSPNYNGSGGLLHSLSSYGALNNLNPNIPAEGSLSRDPSQEILMQELKRLRERVASLETENAGMSIKLNQQQWEVESRLTEIEMQMCGSDSLGSVGSHTSGASEKSNKESII